MAPPPRYDAVAIALHWVMAILILGMLAMGFVMTAQKPGSALQFQLFQIHKSVGITLLALALLRLGWRLGHRPPPLPETMAAWEVRASRAAHAALYLLMLGMPLAGWAVVSTSPLNLPTILYGIVPLPHLPLPRGLNDAVRLLHDGGAWVLAATLAGHAGAALRHHHLLGDDMLRRMLPRFGSKGLGAILAAALLWSGSAQAADWAVDPAKSRLGFTGSQAGSPFEGRFTRWSAKIAFDPSDPTAGKAVVEIDMASAATGDRQKDESLPQAEWFDAKAFPQARFEATSFRAKDGNALEAVGNLVIRGMRKEVVLPFTLEISGPTAHARGRLDLIRTDYGVGQGPWKAADMVALEVAVTFDLTAARLP